MKTLLYFLLVLQCVEYSVAQDHEEMSSHFALVIHGGAGTIAKELMTPEKEKAYHDTLEEALRVGYAILKKGGSSIDAVEATIKVMEDSPLFNAGKGAVFTNAETNEMDASIMDGSSLNAGAVAGVKKIKNPISAARLVLEKSPHVLLAGEGADVFAKENDIEVVDTSYFRIDRRLDHLRRLKKEAIDKEEKIELDHANDRGSIAPSIQDMDGKFGTVGCVALDRHGNITAGTSTGGMTNKRWGRVGDSPIIGAGTYANNKTCGVSSTGYGEFFIRNVAAYDVSALMEYKGLSLEDAVRIVIHEKIDAMNAFGGMIAIDYDGHIAWTFNTKGMYRGKVDHEGHFEIEMYEENN